ncbi:MAG: hypothetical protein RLZZ303_1166, partial [Candidatus Hydrogenedentota bacterium]
ILNAARAACGREGKARVTMDDFRLALNQEVKGGWAMPARRTVGFLKDRQE